jgi:hypothetical protein
MSSQFSIPARVRLVRSAQYVVDPSALDSSARPVPIYDHASRYVAPRTPDSCGCGSTAVHGACGIILGPWARSSMAEQLTLNQRVEGSSPSGLTNHSERQNALSATWGVAIDGRKQGHSHNQYDGINTSGGAW